MKFFTIYVLRKVLFSVFYDVFELLYILSKTALIDYHVKLSFQFIVKLSRE